MLPFSLAAGLSCPTHADLAAALGAEFHDVDEREVDDGLDALAARLSSARHGEPLDQLDVLTAVMVAFEAVAAPLNAHAVHMDVALQRLAGHPTALAVIGAEAARRAGLDLAVAAAGGHHVVAHRALGVQVAYDPALPGVRRLRPGIAAPTWRCSHQVAFCLLREHLDRALRAGDIAGALRAAELRLDLPVEPATRSRLELEQRSLRALLN
jgi:hypothetical protein